MVGCHTRPRDEPGGGGGADLYPRFAEWIGGCMDDMPIGKVGGGPGGPGEYAIEDEDGPAKLDG